MQSAKLFKLILVLFIGIAVLLSGCATISVHSKVNREGVIEKYKIVINTSSFVYGLLVENAKKKGYSSLREYFLSNVSEDMRDKVTYDEIWSGDRVSIIIEVKDCVPKSGAKLKIWKEDNFLIYEDLTFMSEEEQPTDEFSNAILSSFSLHYYLEMPGKIVDSNANVVKDNKAEWHLTGSDAFNARIYAKSEIPSIPGFGLLVGILGLTVAVKIMYRNRR